MCQCGRAMSQRQRGNMKNNKSIMLSLLVVFILSVSCSRFSPTGLGTSENAIAQTVSSDQGATLELDNGASLNIPPNSLPEDMEVSIQVLQKKAKASEAFQPVGNLFEISLGNSNLELPAELTLPYNPNLLPDDITPEMLFIAYFNEEQGQWVYAGGEVDQSQQVIRLQTQHASRWSVFYWNWDAWLATLNKFLEGGWVNLIETVDLLADSCPQQIYPVSVENVNLQNILQGCIEQVNSNQAIVKVINPKSFYYEISSTALNAPILLGPGDSQEISLNLTEMPPLTVKAEITQKAGYRLVIHLVLTMLPGFNAIENQPKTIACISERASDISYFTSAAEALADMNDTSGLSAGEQIVQFLRDQDAVRRFITASDDCLSGLGKTWSLKKIGLISNLASVIISSTDYIANTLAMTFRSETDARVNFQWDQIAVDASDPQSIVNWLKYVINSGNTDLLIELLKDDGIYYANYLEGGQNITNDQFLADLQARISHKPVCQGIYLSDYDLKIWYSDWQPVWQMTELCYDGCRPISPAWESNTAAFMFYLDPESGKYYLRGMYQNTPEGFFYDDNYSLISCDNAQPLVEPTPVSRCPNSPPQRLKVGERGKVCTQKDGVYIRVNPGIDSEKIVTLKPGTRFTVLSGPECAGNNWSWWKVELEDGQVGWLSEGGDVYDPYFLCPDE